MKKLAVYCRYEENGASSRLRFFRYGKFFEQAGVETQYSSFFSREYLEQLYSGKGHSFSSLISGWCRRLAKLSESTSDTWLIEYELLPFLPAFAEKLFFRNKRVYLSFDDPVWEKYANFPILQDKYDTLVSQAAGVIAANDLIIGRFKSLNSNILKVPTAIDLQHYIPCRNMEKYPRLTLVWIGSPATLPYLEQFAPILQKMQEAVNFELLIIGKSSWSGIPGVPCRCVEWSEESEAELLCRSHIGLMPLPDDSFARGKSAYKLIQYAGSAIPALASPVGENCQVIKNGVNGFLCRTPEEWVEKLRLLAADTDLRKKMGANAGVISEKWSMEHHSKAMLKFMDLL